MNSFTGMTYPRHRYTKCSVLAPEWLGVRVPPGFAVFIEIWPQANIPASASNLGSSRLKHNWRDFNLMISSNE